MDHLQILDLVLFSAATFAAAFVTGLAGFAFGIVAASVWLHFLTPTQTAALSQLLYDTGLDPVAISPEFTERCGQDEEPVGFA